MFYKKENSIFPCAQVTQVFQIWQARAIGTVELFSEVCHSTPDLFLSEREEMHIYVAVSYTVKRSSFRLCLNPR